MLFLGDKVEHHDTILKLLDMVTNYIDSYMKIDFQQIKDSLAEDRKLQDNTEKLQKESTHTYQLGRDSSEIMSQKTKTTTRRRNNEAMDIADFKRILQMYSVVAAMFNEIG